MASGEVEGSSPKQADSPGAGRRRDASPAGKVAPPSSTFGFTPAQQIMFQSGNMNGQPVVMVTPEVARSLGIVAPSDGGSGTEASIQVKQESGDVSVSVMDTEDDGMIDPDQFLAIELASGKAEVVMDEDLTSLSWLHSRNLLKADVQLRPGPMAAAPLLVEETAGSELSEESPTSDYLEDSPDAADLCGSPAPAPSATAAALAPAAPATPATPATPAPGDFMRVKRHPPHLPYDPKVHVHFKPPFSFSCLIFMSIEDSPNKALPVKEIYGWILEHFPFYRSAPIGWKNSVRHNLSLNKCFKKVEKAPNMGKGSLWTVDALFRPNLIQALKRSPCVQSTPADGVSHSPASRPWSAAANALNDHPTPARRPGGLKLARARGPAALAGAPAAGHGDQTAGQWDDAPETPAAAAPPPPARCRVRTVTKRSASGSSRKDGENLPNPELFPFLSRRLLSGSGDSGSGGDHQGGANGDDSADGGEKKLVIVQESPRAAKQGKHAKRPRQSDHDYGPLEPRPGGDSVLHPRLVIITRCPEEEHTYALDLRRRLSDDEAFSDDSNLSHEPSGRTGGPSPEEVGMRFVEEGADLLLNLAGVSLPDSRAPRTPAGGRRGSGRPPGRGRAAAR